MTTPAERAKEKENYVDNTETTLIEFCAGYGGIGLGLARVIPGLRTIAVCEIETFAIENLIAKMEAGRIDACPVWNDLRTFPSKEFYGLVDILSAGFPCQPFSHAGLRKGDEDARHLFPAILDAIEHIQPRYVFLENVEGLISAKLGSDCWADPIGTPVLLHVLRELERRGYTATWGIFSAAEVGAPHQRKRVFILAQSCGTGGGGVGGGSVYEGRSASSAGATGIPIATRRAVSAPESNNQSAGTNELAHNNKRLQGLRERSDEKGRSAQAGYDRGCSQVWPSRPGQPQYEWEPPRVVADSKHADRGAESRWVSTSGDEWGSGSQGDVEGGVQAGGQTQPPLGGDTHGAADRMDNAELYTSCDNRVDELRLLGNGVVPATAAKAWQALYQRLQEAA